MEATVALTRLIRRFEHISLIGEPTWRDRYTIRGVNHFEIELGEQLRPL